MYKFLLLFADVYLNAWGLFLAWCGLREIPPRFENVQLISIGVNNSGSWTPLNVKVN